MANWASTTYAVEGPKETLQKIEEAILNHPVAEGSDENWEGNILKALDVDWEAIIHNGKGLYMRGFIEKDSVTYDDNGALRFWAEEAWEVTDFNKALESKFKDIKVYYSTEEPDSDVFATNDKKGKYFPDRFYADTCINDNYQMEYFTKESSVYEWLSKITDGKIKTKEDVDEFNGDVKNIDDFISIHEFVVVE